MDTIVVVAYVYIYLWINFVLLLLAPANLYNVFALIMREQDPGIWANINTLILDLTLCNRSEHHETSDEKGLPNASGSDQLAIRIRI